MILLYWFFRRCHPRARLHRTTKHFHNKRGKTWNFFKKTATKKSHTRWRNNNTTSSGTVRGRRGEHFPEKGKQKNLWLHNIRSISIFLRSVAMFCFEDDFQSAGLSLSAITLKFLAFLGIVLKNFTKENWKFFEKYQNSLSNYMKAPLSTENPPNILEAAQAVNLFTFRSTMLLRRPFYDEKHFLLSPTTRRCLLMNCF